MDVIRSALHGQGDFCAVDLGDYAGHYVGCDLELSPADDSPVPVHAVSDTEDVTGYALIHPGAVNTITLARSAGSVTVSVNGVLTATLLAPPSLQPGLHTITPAIEDEDKIPGDPLWTIAAIRVYVP